MRTVQIAVVQIAGAWRILLSGEKIGRFRERPDALECAVAIAAETRAAGFEVEVLVQDLVGEISLLPPLSPGPAQTSKIA